MRPRGAQVRRTLGIRRKPDSSTKTRWAPSRAVFFDAGPGPLLPALDPFFIALERAPLRLLHGPSQTMEEPAHVVAVVSHAKLLPDQPGDPGRRPELGGVAVVERALQQQPHQALALSRIKLGRAPRREPHAQRLGAPLVSRIAPAHDGARRAVEQPRDLVQRAALIQEPERPMAPALQKLGRARQSHNEHLPGGASFHYLCRSQ